MGVPSEGECGRPWARVGGWWAAWPSPAWSVTQSRVARLAGARAGASREGCCGRGARLQRALGIGIVAGCEPRALQPLLLTSPCLVWT